MTRLEARAGGRSRNLMIIISGIYTPGSLRAEERFMSWCSAFQVAASVVQLCIICSRQSVPPHDLLFSLVRVRGRRTKKYEAKELVERSVQLSTTRAAEVYFSWSCRARAWPP